MNATEMLRKQTRLSHPTPILCALLQKPKGDPDFTIHDGTNLPVSPVLCARVELFVDFFQVVPVYVGVYLGGGDGDVAQHFLEASQVCTAGEQVRGEAVADCVDGEFFRHACAEGVFLYEPPDIDAVHGPAGP